MNVFYQKIAYLDISSPNYAKTSQVFQNIVTIKSIAMQMISDFMHFHVIALRQKNTIWKVDGYNIRSMCINWPLLYARVAEILWQISKQSKLYC